MGIDVQIDSPQSTIFRKAYIKRRLGSTGLFESSWTEITEFVKKFGSLNSSIDAIRFNKFLHSGVSLSCRNDEGTFNKEDNIGSLWSGYMTRRMSLVKLEGGYLDTDGSELPADPTLGIFVLDQEVPISAKSNTATLKCSSLKSIFDNERAKNIAGLGATQSASDIIAVIRDHTDGSGTPIFRQFITSSSWTIEATTNQYNFATTTSINEISAWELMEKLAESENKVVLINRTGGVEFRSRDARTTTVAYAFKGQGFNRQNMKSLDLSNESWDKFYSQVELKHERADTSASKVTSGTTTSVSPSDLRWKYGQETYKFENTAIINTATAQAIADAVLVQASTVDNEIEFEACLVPSLEVLDRISVSYRSYDLSQQTIWDHFNWDEAVWGGDDNFDYDAKEFIVIKKNPNIDSFMMKIIAREA